MRHRLACLAVAAAAATWACDVAAMGPQEHQQVNETRRLDPQGTFTLENTNGTVVIESWSESSVSIEAEKVAPESELDDLRVEIKGEGSRVDVTTRYPRSGWGRSHGHVDYRVKVPRDARVEVETTNGAVKVLGAGGSVRATTTNGSVEVAEAGGDVEASTTNGSIRAGYRQSPSGGSQRLSTTNGSVTLTLPADASGEFSASTVNGGISTDFPLQVSGRFGGRKLRGRLGDGPARFELSTVNGAVKILKRGGA
jgi:DUF4097 and DUF4098 domain-containing protein YvlB